MDFSFTEEQTLLQDSIARFIQNDYKFEQRQKLVSSELGYSEENWRQFADLGWLGVLFSEADGGYGGSAVDAMILFEQFGRGLVVEPVIPSVVLAGGAIKHGGNVAQKARYLPGIIDGSTQGALAYAEPQGRFNLADLTTTATAAGDGFVVSGYKCVVMNGPNADVLVVSARTDGDQRDEDGVSLFVMDMGAEGISRRDYPTVDGLRASEITFENVMLGADALLGESGTGLPTLQRVIDDGILAVGAEAVGCMEVLYKDTVEYCKQREQFGQPIGKFQVLQHRMVDMFMEHEQSKSLLYMAAMRLDEGYSEEAQKAVAALKVQVGKSGRFVGQNAVQLHGGMGMTDELNIGHYFKRLTTIDTLFGNADFQLKRFGTL
ncbi:MAG: acyl-CoA dehydrogenase family protein [Pseudomonadales bacterium]|mgnify:CR=1 FL=1|jgi:alkylation response protein AidB-like acyl-CoA dehydrogenase|nr:acyl-CoA dehydrogenase family protein [Pseudomonadales bacterium]MDP6471994.1 acyl-CoA dehydrogenase family protein [Pseudomonadales bacterium]MDP6826735.1 acyl-CoA dehydrogenase family protein [Pseudomonadales bacterium]MDP6972669.1 acyl-CoA dehydrogenase family protein [Pseudomonadales bacterium]|tara:strand:+ start:440 stop:1570 length:1131 start_codon:yes stop_codon:yes gene_type:complete